MGILNIVIHRLKYGLCIFKIHLKTKYTLDHIWDWIIMIIMHKTIYQFRHTPLQWSKPLSLWFLNIVILSSVMSLQCLILNQMDLFVLACFTLQFRRNLYNFNIKK